MNSNEQETFHTSMEKALIEEYLNDQGYSWEKLQHLPERVVKYLLKEATRYATLKMEEIKAKAHLVKEMHENALHHD